MHHSNYNSVAGTVKETIGNALGSTDWQKAGKEQHAKGEAEIKAADPDNDGTLDEKEYMAVVEQKFKAADPDDDGTVDLKELESPAGQDLLKLIYK